MENECTLHLNRQSARMKTYNLLLVLPFLLLNSCQESLRSHTPGLLAKNINRLPMRALERPEQDLPEPLPEPPPLPEIEIPEVMEEPIIIFPEVEPSFPGGKAAFADFIEDELEYPMMAQEMGIQGKVYVQFTVEKDGSVTNVHVVRGIDKTIDKEAMRVVANMPKWSPGESAGRKKAASFVLPIRFVLD